MTNQLKLNNNNYNQLYKIPSKNHKYRVILKKI